MAKKKPPTLDDVAARAGVSPKTVSNVVNGYPHVAEKTRARVRKAIEALDYRPSALARSLVTGKTRTIGVMIPDVSNPFFGQAVLGCEKVLDKFGYSISLCDTEEDLEKEKRSLGSLIERGMDGLVLWGGQLGHADLLSLTKGQVTTIAIDSAIEKDIDGFTFIDIENEKGAVMAVDHLVNAGRRRIAHISGPQGRMSARRRISGYRLALSNAGIDFDPCLIVETSPSIRGGYRAALELLRSQRPDAVFCYNDLIAIGTVVACNHLGLRIPDDLALVGFDDITMSALITPSLTTVRIAQHDLGMMAGRMILHRLAGHRQAENRVSFPVSLEVRNSCGTKTLTPDDMRNILDSLASSEAVDLAANYPARCKEAPNQ